MNTPVLFLVFNRPDKTRQVFERIREARPTKLLVAADGPRAGRSGEAGLCEETRRVVLDGVDWPCEVKTLFRDRNLGCRLAVSGAISWFFEHVEEGIILEDDCLPDLSFFPFCKELLERYRDDDRIMMISGDNLFPESEDKFSYHFTRFCLIWGWATWRRAWVKYDLNLQAWPALAKEPVFMDFLRTSARKRAVRLFNSIYQEGSSSWDYQWLFSCWVANGLSINPNVNLVTNIDPSGTHMKPYDPGLNMACLPMAFPMRHPDQIHPDCHIDAYTEKYLFIRSGPRTVIFIVKYLGTFMIRQPSKLPSALLSVFLALLQEGRMRLKSRIQTARMP